MNKSTQYFLIGCAVLLAIAGTAVASSYFTKQSIETADTTPVVAEPPAKKVAAKPHHQQVAATKPTCDDHNVVGTVGGAVAGGLVGSAFGKGSGKGLATAGGAVAGGALGNAYIPTRGATCD